MTHKKYRTWVEISQSAFDHNISLLKSTIGARLLALVVKANAYGHGMEQIATLAEQNDLVDWLCVAFASEALALKNLGISKPILVMSCIDTKPELLINTNIHCMVDNNEIMQQLNAIGKTYNYMFPVHIKIDTGLSRFGVTPDQVLPFIQAANQLQHVSIQGIYSHFAESDKEDKTFTKQQLEHFQAVLQELAAHNITIPHIHFSNSAATTTLNLPFCNLFRVGINAYGLWSSPATKESTQKKFSQFTLRPVATWKSKIIALKTVVPQNFIGYGRTFQAPRLMRIAIIPIGYYDGYDIRFSNNGSMLLHNQYAPIVGRVAMNTTSIDVTNIKNVQVNDDVILMGNYPHIHPHELATQIQTINTRELLTKINPLIPRIIR